MLAIVSAQRRQDMKPSSPDALLKLLLIATILLILSVGTFRWSPTALRAAGSEPVVGLVVAGNGFRITVFYPETKTLYEYKDNGACDNSWTLGAPGQSLTENKCK